MPDTFNRRLVPLLLAMTTGLAACQRATPAEPPAPAASAGAERSGPPPATHEVAAIDASLSLVNNNGHVRYDGLVDSEASRQQVLAVLQQAYGPERISGTIRVGTQARAPAWLEGLPAFVEAFSASGAAVGFEGQRIDLLGAVAMPQRRQLRERAHAIYPGYRLGGLFEGSAAPGAAARPAADALASLEPGATPQQLVAALNGMQLRFATGSARIDGDGLDILGRAARAIAAAPAGTRLRLQSRAADARLARQRAEAVKVQLILNGVSPGMIQTEAATGAEGLAFSLAG